MVVFFAVDYLKRKTDISLQGSCHAGDRRMSDISVVFCFCDKHVKIHVFTSILSTNVDTFTICNTDSNKKNGKLKFCSNKPKII